MTMAYDLSNDEPLESALSGLHVLAVDDNPDTVQLTAVLLRHCGAVVRTAESTKEALQILNEWRPHALLCDVKMPEEDGVQFIARVRRLPGRLGSIPAIAITAYTEPQDRTRALSAGFTDVMAKPFDLLALVGALWHMRPAARDVPSEARS